MQWKLQIKAGYSTEEKRVWRFCVIKNCYTKYNINKINAEKEKKIAFTKYFFFMFFEDVQCIEKWPHAGVLCKGCY